MKMSGKR